jgi:hypothetical protein
MAAASLQIVQEHAMTQPERFKPFVYRLIDVKSTVNVSTLLA